MRRGERPPREIIGYRTALVCLCGALAEEHLPWNGDCQGYIACGKSRSVPIYAKPGRTKAFISPELRWEVWERDNFTCRECGSRRFLHVDHIIAEKNGGTLDLENLQTLCRTCNCRKGCR